MPLAAGAAKPCISENHHYPPTVGHGEQPVEPSDAGQGGIPSRKGTKNGKRNFRCQLPAILIPPDTWERNACGTFSFRCFNRAVMFCIFSAGCGSTNVCILFYEFVKLLIMASVILPVTSTTYKRPSVFVSSTASTIVSPFRRT